MGNDEIKLAFQRGIGRSNIQLQKFDILQLQLPATIPGNCNLRTGTIHTDKLCTTAIVRQRQQIAAITTAQFQHTASPDIRTGPAVQQRRQRKTFRRRPFNRLAAIGQLIVRVAAHIS